MGNERVPPRVAVMSLRNFETHVSRACGFEFEDMICGQLDFARLIAPGPGRQTSGLRVIRNRAMRGIGSRSALNLLNRGVEKVELGADHDLFFFSVAQLRDLAELSVVPDWRERSRFAVCWLQELWVRDITPDNKLLDILNQFDHVICSFHHSIEPLSQRIEVPVSYLPWGVDTELFCPYPNAPRRAIEVAGIGEIPKTTERALVRYTDEIGAFFHYQTVFGPSVIRSHEEHRHNYAGLLKRSKYFLCYLAKAAFTAERGQQEEFGLRYIEGVAAGTVLLGDPVDNPAFRQYLGWPDAVTPLAAHSETPDKLIRQLERDPARIASIRRANLTHALTGLDHLHRWQDVLKIANLPQTPGMIQRRRRLDDLAAEIEATDDEELADEVHGDKVVASQSSA